MNSPDSCHLSLQPDASFFRIDLPNSGNVVLNKPLDYETRTQLKVILWAQVTLIVTNMMLKYQIAAFSFNITQKVISNPKK